eukprot:1875670-Prymnesium_polylepis.1
MADAGRWAMQGHPIVRQSASSQIIASAPAPPPVPSQPEGALEYSCTMAYALRPMMRREAVTGATRALRC